VHYNQRKVTAFATAVISDLVGCIKDRTVLLKATNCSYLNQYYHFTRTPLCDCLWPALLRSRKTDNEQEVTAGCEGGLSRILQCLERLAEWV